MTPTECVCRCAETLNKFDPATGVAIVFFGLPVALFIYFSLEKFNKTDKEEMSE